MTTRDRWQSCWVGRLLGLAVVSRCRVCAAPLGRRADPRTGLCNRRACRLRDAMQRAAARRRLKRAAVARAARQALMRAAERLHLDYPRALVVAVVPANTRQLAPLPAARRRAFRAHLLEQIDVAARSGRQRAAAVPVGVETPPPQIAAGCATCRGQCCSRGGDHAFVDFATIWRYGARTGVTDASAVARAFLRHLPTVSYQGSCVYHTATGCSLPRVMRGDVCNRFYCGPLVEQWTVLARADDAATAIAAADEQRLIRLAVVDDQATWLVRIDRQHRSSSPELPSASR